MGYICKQGCWLHNRALTRSIFICLKIAAKSVMIESTFSRCLSHDASNQRLLVLQMQQQFQLPANMARL